MAVTQVVEAEVRKIYALKARPEAVLVDVRGHYRLKRANRSMVN